MKTPVADFVRKYSQENIARFHMPGHKGKGFLGCEELDITEVVGADSLYEAEGIIALSQANASELFGSEITLFSTEGSSQCIKAMLYLAGGLSREERPLILAARNVHKAFIYGAALLDFDVSFIMPRENNSLCSASVSAQAFDEALAKMEKKPCAVYVTSPDYLGFSLDISALAEVCHKWGIILMVDNAHGAYLHFLENKCHPLDLGADICCDSAHKTLPVLTGGAYLHISKNAPDSLKENARQAMALFGSTSPSYLIMASLDLCNKYLREGYNERLKKTINEIESLKNHLKVNGWCVADTEPLKLTLMNIDSTVKERLLENKISYEYADMDFIVLMITPENNSLDFDRLKSALGKNQTTPKDNFFFTLSPKSKMSVRKAVLSPKEEIKAENALGRICSSPTVSCPPAIPICIPGEEIDQNAIMLFKRYGIDKILVVK